MIDVYAIRLCHFYHRVYNGTGLGAVRRIIEEPVLVGNRKWIDGIFTEPMGKATPKLLKFEWFGDEQCWRTEYGLIDIKVK